MVGGGAASARADVLQLMSRHDAACVPSLPPAPCLCCCAHPHDWMSAEYICKRLSEWATQFQGAGYAGFFKPCAYLQAAARQGRRLSAGIPPASKL